MPWRRGGTAGVLSPLRVDSTFAPASCGGCIVCCFPPQCQFFFLFFSLGRKGFSLLGEREISGLAKGQGSCTVPPPPLLVPCPMGESRFVSLCVCGGNLSVPPASGEATKEARFPLISQREKDHSLPRQKDSLLSRVLRGAHYSNFNSVPIS